MVSFATSCISGWSCCTSCLFLWDRRHVEDICALYLEGQVVVPSVPIHPQGISPLGLRPAPWTPILAKREPGGCLEINFSVPKARGGQAQPPAQALSQSITPGHKPPSTFKISEQFNNVSQRIKSFSGPQNNYTPISAADLANITIPATAGQNNKIAVSVSSQMQFELSGSSQLFTSIVFHKQTTSSVMFFSKAVCYNGITAFFRESILF